jgi:hypothetical protein
MEGVNFTLQAGNISSNIYSTYLFALKILRNLSFQNVSGNSEIVTKNLQNILWIRLIFVLHEYRRNDVPHSDNFGGHKFLTFMLPEDSELLSSFQFRQLLSHKVLPFHARHLCNVRRLSRRFIEFIWMKYSKQIQPTRLNFIGACSNFKECDAPYT